MRLRGKFAESMIVVWVPAVDMELLLAFVLAREPKLGSRLVLLRQPCLQMPSKSQRVGTLRGGSPARFGFMQSNIGRMGSFFLLILKGGPPLSVATLCLPPFSLRDAIGCEEPASIPQWVLMKVMASPVWPACYGRSGPPVIPEALTLYHAAYSPPGPCLLSRQGCEVQEYASSWLPTVLTLATGAIPEKVRLDRNFTTGRSIA